MSAFPLAEWTTAQLVQAVERGQLELHYQPIVDLRSGEITGAESLLRWQHPSLGLLLPGQFLPVAESSGLMPEIGAWVLREACRQMHDWQPLQWRPFRLAVNVSARQMGADFYDQVQRVLADAGLSAEYLEIELTESAAFGDPVISPVLDALRAIGVRFAADDFGTGYTDTAGFTDHVFALMHLLGFRFCRVSATWATPSSTFRRVTLRMPRSSQ